jgi:hypothetical protein
MLYALTYVGMSMVCALLLWSEAFITQGLHTSVFKATYHVDRHENMDFRLLKST